MQVKQFLDLPLRIYAGVPKWTPPLEVDARRMLNLEKHPIYKHGRALFLKLYCKDL
jgi:hypothetical protein